MTVKINIMKNNINHCHLILYQIWLDKAEYNPDMIRDIACNNGIINLSQLRQHISKNFIDIFNDNDINH